MTGINVLSDTLKGGNKLENIVPSKEKRRQRAVKMRQQFLLLCLMAE